MNAKIMKKKFLYAMDQIKAWVDSAYSLVSSCRGFRWLYHGWQGKNLGVFFDMRIIYTDLSICSLTTGLFLQSHFTIPERHKL